MQAFFKKYPLHYAFLIAFVLLYLVNYNFNQISWPLIKRSIFVSLALIALLVLLIFKFHNNRYKSAMLYTAILAPLLLYGAIYEFLEQLYYQGLWPFQNIHRYLLILISLLTAFFIYKISRTSRLLIKATYTLNMIFLTLAIMNLSSLLYKIVIDRSDSDGEVMAKRSGRSASPDLYYLLLDGYANDNVLRKYYGYDNSTFRAALTKKGFSVFDSARTSYYGTSRSLNSIFNMTYPELHAEKPVTFKNNRFFRQLKEYGYKIYQLESGYSVSDYCNLEDEFIYSQGLNEFERTVMKLTIFRLDDLFGAIPYTRLKKQLDKMQELVEHGEKPKFVFIHIVAPHPPFVFDSEGKRNITLISHENSWEPKQKYVMQLEYVNKRVIEFLNKLPEGACAIVQSDHGPWIKADEKQDIYEARSLVLNAVKFPGKSVIEKNLPLVNTFRLFNQLYLDSTVKLLPFIEPAKQELFNSPRVKQLLK